jgi:oxygen-independent coproporphyrinogen-3 oxidase
MVSSLYIHIPFCIKRCVYCDFVSGIYESGKADNYIAALKKEISGIPAGSPLSTLFIGGGTPTALSTKVVSDLADHVFDHFDFASDYEATIEANPGTVDRAKLAALRTVGINRLSIGVQSFNNEELAVLGRMHSSEEAVQAVELARDAGFENVGIDLIYGIPGQDMISWKKNLEKAVALHPRHISAYELTVEEGTVLAGLLKPEQKGGTVKLLEEEIIIEMYKYTIDYLTSNGYVQYEISNFAEPEFLCRHNLNYWDRGEYFGAGLGAHSFTGSRRFHNTADLDEYINKLSENRDAVRGSEFINKEKALSEAIFLGLRKTTGINLKMISKALDTDILSTHLRVIHELQQAGLVEFDIKKSHLRLTDKGRLLSNEVFERFL